MIYAQLQSIQHGNEVIDRVGFLPLYKVRYDLGFPLWEDEIFSDDYNGVIGLFQKTRDATPIVHTFARIRKNVVEEMKYNKDYIDYWKRRGVCYGK